MLQLDASEVQIGATARNKAEAIEKVGALLVRTGHIEPGYIDSMKAREKVANTFLGNGIAIPHGIPKDRDLILRTGVAVLQVPGGVEWNPGDIVHLVVGIAAKSDEHLQVLTNLTDVLGDETEAARLARTTDPADIARRLSGGGVATKPEEAAAPEDLDHWFDAVIVGPHGLHARPATALVELSKGFASDIRVRNGARVGDAKSLISLLKLGVEGGATIRVMADGPDAIEALAAIKAAIDAGLEDEEDAAADAAPIIPGHTAIDYQGRTAAGISASPGIALGPIRQFVRARIVVEATARDQAAESKKLDKAFATARAELSQLHDEVMNRSGAGKAAIFRAQAEFLDDPEMLREAGALIRAGRSAGWAWQNTYEEHAGTLASMNDPVLSARALDLRDVGRRVLRQLADTVEDDPQLPDSPVILLADDLTPSDTAGLDPKFVLGLCTASGGPTSHTAIIARSLDIPAIVSAGDSVLDLADDTYAILDGNGGVLVVDPTDADREAARRALVDHEAQRDAERLARYQPAITTDDVRIEVVGNIGGVDEAEAAVEAGGEGVGLLRTEFQFLQRDTPPTEDEQFGALSAMTQAMNGLPIIVRTLDIGGDKEVPYLRLPHETNPFLGVRGIRLCLAREDLFRPQLRAIFRAAATGPIRIMYPMVATIEELRRAKEITETVRQELGADPVEIGMMMEIPSAVMMAPEFAREVDFFSIGTNDLTQYTLAMDRMHPQLAKQADGLHPAVLRLIDRLVRAADDAGIWVGACGGIAGDPLGVAILTGLGLKELSVSIPSIAAVKAQVRAMSMADAKRLAGRALACATASEVRALV
ncbi:phosphoenolpyruvate--protein phosphotransferase [Tropicimonas sp.]|uniref:phosphoenolpyruvate--protein phosphotransferase n=1 Tax=Tropicimonas sp. TaxID=2067044 RepID=UPI003A8B7062